MNGAGRSEFAIYFRIFAVKTFLTEVIVVFHTFVGGFPFWMKFASAHYFFLLYQFKGILHMLSKVLYTFLRTTMEKWAFIS